MIGFELVGDEETKRLRGTSTPYAPYSPRYGYFLSLYRLACDTERLAINTGCEAKNGLDVLVT